MGRKQSFRLPPVDTFKEHRQLFRCEEHFAIDGLTAREAAALNLPFGQQTQSFAGRPEELS
jgi:hypothetical protein